MSIIKRIENKFSNYNFLIYLFLIWNSLKLFFINAEARIQILNLLISIGIYFFIEDQNLQIKGRRRISFLIGLLGISFTVFRSIVLNNIDDKYYYLNLPIGIFFLIILLKPFNEFIYLRKIFFMSLLLPLRRLFYYLANYFLQFLIPFFTWLILFCLRKNPILDGQNIFINDTKIMIITDCLGADNLYFVLAVISIYFFIFRLRILKNYLVILFSSITISISINTIRNVILALVVTSDLSNKDEIFHFLHDSFGQLIFSFFSVLLTSWIYFKLLDKELKNQ